MRSSSLLGSTGAYMTLCSVECLDLIGVGVLLDSGHLAQLVRALHSHCKGHWFESSNAHQRRIFTLLQGCMRWQ